MTYVIDLNTKQAVIICAIAVLSLLGWSWGTLLKSGLGVSRWYGALMLLPGVNLIAFVIAGIIADYRLEEERKRPARERAKRFIAEISAEIEENTKISEKTVNG